MILIYNSKKKRYHFSLAPPSSPRNLSVVFQDQSVIVVAWLAPSDSGGRDDVVYDVNCFQCDASLDCSYRKPCNGKLEFWPMKFNNPHTHVTVTALQPNTSYVLRITAENGVSHLYGPNSNRSAEIQFGTKISGTDGTLIISLPVLLSLPTPIPLRSFFSPSLLPFVSFFLPPFFNPPSFFQPLSLLDAR